MSINSPHRAASASAADGSGASAGLSPLEAAFAQQSEALQRAEAHNQQLQGQNHHLQQLHQQAISAPPPLDVQHLAVLLQQQADAHRLAQSESLLQILAAQSTGPLPEYSGKGATSGTQTEEWLKRAERWFSARELTSNPSQQAKDISRMTIVADALRDDAARWYESIPEASRPATWDSFRKTLLARFNSAPTESVRHDRLRSFAAAGAKLKDKMTLEGVHTFVSRFQQLASQVPDYLITHHGKLELLGQALPARCGEPIWEEHRKDPAVSALTPMHTLIDKVMSKAYAKGYAQSHSSGAAGSAAASSLDGSGCDSALLH